jgi:hypothetical protein
MSKSNRTLLEWSVVGVGEASLVGAAVFLGAADLAMLATLLVVPILVVMVLRRRMSLLEKLKLVSPAALAMPVVLCVMWLVQSPGEVGYLLVGGACGLVFFVTFDLMVKLIWTQRDAA